MVIDLYKKFTEIGFEKKSGDLFLFGKFHIVMGQFQCYLLIYDSKKDIPNITNNFYYKYVNSGVYYINEEEERNYNIFMNKIKNYIRLYKIKKIISNLNVK